MIKKIIALFLVLFLTGCSQKQLPVYESYDDLSSRLKGVDSWLYVSEDEMMFSEILDDENTYNYYAFSLWKDEKNPKNIYDIVTKTDYSTISIVYFLNPVSDDDFSLFENYIDKNIKNSNSSPEKEVYNNGLSYIITSDEDKNETYFFLTKQYYIYLEIKDEEKFILDDLDLPY